MINFFNETNCDNTEILTNSNASAVDEQLNVLSFALATVISLTFTGVSLLNGWNQRRKTTVMQHADPETCGSPAVVNMNGRPLINHFDTAESAIQHAVKNGLTRVNLSGISVTSTQIRNLLETNPEITELIIDSSHDFSLFASGVLQLKKINSLVLNNLKLTELDAVSIAYSPLKLKKLHLENNHIGTEGLEALANSRNLSQMEELNVSRNWICTANAEKLIQSSGLQRVSLLTL